MVTYDARGTPVRLDAVMTVGPSPADAPAAERLYELQNMEAVGRLAGGIAHDFNNLLTGILSYCDLILQELRSDDPVRADVEQIRRASLRAADRTHQLLAFSGRQILQPQVVSLNAVADGLVVMLRRLLGAARTLEMALEPDLWPVFADPGQLEQVVIHLVTNARDAMPDGGRVTIATANVAFQGSARVPVGRGTLGPGEYVRLSVTDTGIGMDPAVQARIFEPFFTTKSPGHGAGLGLATAIGIVRQSGGEIAVESAPGAGTAFHVYLPRSREPVPTAPPTPPSRSLLGGTETVLLVDDEAEVRASARRLLERYGYKVLETAHGAEALRFFDANADRIGLVLTDVVMPEMNGRELVERLRAAHPSAKVLFMSGYTETAIVVDGRLPPNTGVLEKPFTVEELLRQVRTVLDGVPPGQPAPPAG
jgi:nitrogen-specific signal transduction histidine kinase/ActR/RegA family two-component response regulator